VDFRKDLPFLFCELGLCSKDNGAKKRTHSIKSNRFPVSELGFRGARPSPLARRTERRGDAVDFRKELPFLFCEFGPSSRVNCVTRPQNGGFIPIV
jgi:hypothetical protein